MAEKVLKTKIQLRYDEFTNWTTNNPFLKKGEIAVTVIPAAATNTGDVIPPAIMFKVGNGEEGDASKFNSLPWASALAADVHPWAKAKTAPVIPKVGNGKITIKQAGTEKGSFTVNQDDPATISLDDTDTNTQYQLYLSDHKLTLQSKEKGATSWTNVQDVPLPDNNTTYTFTSTATSGASFKVIPSGGTAQTVYIDGLKSAAFTESSAYATAAQGNKADSAVQTVKLESGTNNGTLKLTVDGTATDNIEVKGLKNSNAFKTVDTTPTASSTNLITSGGVKTYVDTQVAGVVKYMGTVANVTALTALTPDSKGDFCRASAAFKMTAALSATGAEIQVHASDMLVCEAVKGKDSATATTYSIIHGEIDSNTWTANSVNAAGYVSAPTTSNKNKVWKTDENGNPGWRDDKDTTYSAGTGISIVSGVINHSNSITAGTASGDASKTLKFGDTFTIPSISYDAQGHIKSKTTTTMTMPANPNTNQTVKVGTTTFGPNTAVTIKGGSHASVTAADDTITVAAIWPTASDSGYAGINKTGTVTKVSATAGSGLKITGTDTTTPNIDWDDTVTLVFDCGDSNGPVQS